MVFEWQARPLLLLLLCKCVLRRTIGSNSYYLTLLVLVVVSLLSPPSSLYINNSIVPEKAFLESAREGHLSPVGLRGWRRTLGPVRAFLGMQMSGKQQSRQKKPTPTPTHPTCCFPLPSFEEWTKKPCDGVPGCLFQLRYVCRAALLCAWFVCSA